MGIEKRYYWLKLKEDFFDSIRIKKLRSLAGGDTFTIIYLKMLINAMKNDGILQYQGLEKNICDEIALDLNEQADNVEVTLKYLLSCGLAEEMGSDCFLPEAVEMVGSEQGSAERVREFRKRQQALHCNDDVTDVKRIGNTEIDIDKEIDIEIEIDKKTPSKKFIPPTLEEVQNYCHERGNSVDAERFISYYNSNGWMVGRNKMKSWQDAVITWEKNDKKKKKETSNDDFLERWANA